MNRMSFTESSTVERMLLNSVARTDSQVAPAAQWEYVPGPELPRQSSEAIVEPWVREALVRLNPGQVWTITGQAGANLTLDGLFISGGDIVLRDRVGLRPTRPQQAAGTRIEPKPSEACAIGNMRVPTAAAAPPLEPPEMRSCPRDSSSGRTARARM